MPLTHARWAFFGLALLLSCSSGSKGSTTEVASTPAEKSVTIFLSAEIKGTTEPCGCTADPLGDLARTTEMILEARKKGPLIMLDGGSTLYSETKLNEKIRFQEELKSTLIEKTLVDTINIGAIALGPYDLSEGPAKVRPARQAANLGADSGIALEPPKLIEAGEVKVGVFGVVSPAALEGSGIAVGDPAPAAVAAIADLKAQGADLVIALAQMTAEEAQSLVRAAPGIDFVLISRNLPEPADVQAEPMRVRDTWLFSPANRGQVISRLDLSLRTSGPWTDAIGEARAKVAIAKLGEEIPSLQSDLSKWASDPNADPSFIAAKKRELEELTAYKARLETSPVQAPKEGNYFTLTQVRVAKSLPCDKDVVAAKQAYDAAAGAHNVEAGKDIKPVPPAKGQASYVGIEECESCHEGAVDFWKGTHHASAWATLESVGKEFNFDCVACHTTGFDKPGGSNIAYTEGLQNVQCEQCHGPGSLHVDAEGPMRKSTIVRSPESSVCQQCHTPDHSDTFAFEAYLRDITGPGHGEEKRNALGPGETGRALRAAALKKAGAAIGEHCPK